MNESAIKDLLYKIADDQLIIGHRNSEWTGLGPLLEEDIAFASMAQDKIGHCFAFYKLLNQLGEAEPDSVAFNRKAAEFHCCHLVELPIGEYDFSLMRHFLFDTAEMIRFEMLSNSSWEPVAQISKKLTGEVKYHTMHAKIWIKQLGSAPESIERLQRSLEYALPFALGIFEPSKFEKELAEENMFEGENILKEKWIERVEEVISKTGLEMPDHKIMSPSFGGRYGEHTEHLQPLLNEMSEVFNIDPTAEW